MKAKHWRQSIATIVTAGLLAAGAAAQDGAQGEVNITEKTPTTTQVEGTKTGLEKPEKPQIVERDPFVNQLGNSHWDTDNNTGPIRRPIVSPNDGDSSPTDAPALTQEPDIEVPAPEVAVNGIVMSTNGNQAIISTDNGTRTISQGQQLGDYQVAEISSKKVVFSYGGDKFFDVALEE